MPVDLCECPVCPDCGWQGRPECYAEHSLAETHSELAEKARVWRSYIAFNAEAIEIGDWELLDGPDDDEEFFRKYVR
jgi:hypothetical protein